MSLAEHDPRASPWRDYHAAPSRRLDLPSDRRQLEIAQDGFEDGAHLEHREMVTGASLASAAPRHPDLRSGRGIEEAFGPEPVRFGVQARVVLHEVDAADELDGRAIDGARDLEGPADHPGDREQEDGTVAEHLLDRGREISLATSVEVVNQAPCDGRIMGEQLKRPRKLGRRRLMPREDHRHEGVSNLRNARPIVVRVLATKEHGEQSAVPSAAVRLLFDQLRDDLIDRGALDEEAPPDASPSRHASERGLLQGEASRHRKHCEQSPVQLPESRFLTSKYRLQNHSQRECP